MRAAARNACFLRAIPVEKAAGLETSEETECDPRSAWDWKRKKQGAEICRSRRGRGDGWGEGRWKEWGEG